MIIYNKMMLSVIVPIYNVEKYISDCVESLIKQNYKDFEVIFVDDGSTDESISILENILKTESNLNYKIIHKTNAGLPQARKTGISVANGEYVTFLDSDDWIEPGYLAKSMAFVSETKLDLYNLGYYEDYGNKLVPFSKINEFKIINFDEYVDLLHKRILFHTMCSKIIRKKNLEELFIFPEGNFIYEDYITLIPALKSVSRIGLIPESGYHYRIRSDSMGHGAFDSNKKLGYSKITNLYPKVIEWFPSCKNSINCFFSIEYMALVISMGRNKKYDNEIIHRAKKFLIKNIKTILFSNFVDIKFKLSIVPIILFPKAFARLYCLIKY